MTDPVTTPIAVNPSVVPEATGTVLRDVAIVLAAFPIVAKLVGAHDLSGLLKWLQSSDGATFLAVVAPLALTAWRSRKSILRKLKFVRVAEAAPNSIAIVTKGANP